MCFTLPPSQYCIAPPIAIRFLHRFYGFTYNCLNGKEKKKIYNYQKVFLVDLSNKLLFESER